MTHYTLTNERPPSTIILLIRFVQIKIKKSPLWNAASFWQKNIVPSEMSVSLKTLFLRSTFRFRSYLGFFSSSLFMNASLCCFCALMLTFPFISLMGSGDYTILLLLWLIFIYIKWYATFSGLDVVVMNIYIRSTTLEFWICNVCQWPFWI